MTEPKYWERASLEALSKDLDEIDNVPIVVIGCLKRLVKEIEDLKARRYL